MAKKTTHSYIVQEFAIEQEVPTEKPDKPSRSQKKRDALALQALGESLANLDRAQYAALELPRDLIKALADYKTMRTHEAKRRQRQLIGKLMRTIPQETIALLTTLCQT